MLDSSGINGPICGGAGTALGLYAYGASSSKMMCGALGFIVGSSIALSSSLCTDPTYNYKKPPVYAHRGGGPLRCHVLIGTDTYGLTTDAAIGTATAALTILYCGGNWGQVLSGCAGGLIGSTGIQYMTTPTPAKTATSGTATGSGTTPVVTPMMTGNGIR